MLFLYIFFTDSNAIKISFWRTDEIFHIVFYTVSKENIILKVSPEASIFLLHL